MSLALQLNVIHPDSTDNWRHYGYQDRLAGRPMLCGTSNIAERLSYMTAYMEADRLVRGELHLLPEPKADEFYAVGPVILLDEADEDEDTMPEHTIDIERDGELISAELEMEHRREYWRKIADTAEFNHRMRYIFAAVVAMSIGLLLALLICVPLFATH